MKMFGVEPYEPWEPGEREEFEKHVAAIQTRVNIQAGCALAAFLLLCIVTNQFLAGHSLHRYWDTVGRWLLLLTLGSLFWLVLKAGSVWAAWQAARDTRKEFE